VVTVNVLIPRPWRPVAVLAWLAAAVVLAVLSWHFAHSGASDAADLLVGAHVKSRLATHPHLLSLAAQLGSPAVVVGASLALAVLWFLGGRRRAALFALLAAPAAGAVTELVLKPAVHRQVHPEALMFPSGHTTGAFALALTVVVLLLPREQTRLLPALAGLVIGIAALALAAVVAVAVVALGWHFVTDAIGGVVTAVVVVLGMAALLDATASATGPR
jgi:undecaprenyl-diphosphatase